MVFQVILKPVVVRNCVEIRDQTGQVLLKVFDTTPLKAIRKTIRLIDYMDNYRKNGQDVKWEE
jgi:hypothetical protein